MVYSIAGLSFTNKRFRLGRHIRSTTVEAGHYLSVICFILINLFSAVT